VPFFQRWLTQFGGIKRNQALMKLGQFHYYPSSSVRKRRRKSLSAEPNGMKLGQFHYSVRNRRRKLLSDEHLIALAVGLTVGALGLWLILRASN
jgi:hypothetical protein